MHRAESRAPWEPKLPLRFWKVIVGEGGNSFTDPHLCAQPTQTLFWSLSVLLWSTLLPLSSHFSFHVPLFAAAGWTWQWKCWMTGAGPTLLLTQTQEPVLIRFRCSVPDFSTQKNSDTYLNKTSWGWTIPSTEKLRGPDTRLSRSPSSCWRRHVNCA